MTLFTPAIESLEPVEVLADATEPRAGEVLAPPIFPPEPWRDMPFTWLGMALDRVALRGMRTVFASILSPSTVESEAVRNSAAPYITPELLKAPRRFFRFLDDAPNRVIMHETEWREIEGGFAISRRFPTEYVPYHSIDPWPDCAENDSVTVEHWVHRPGPPRATVLALHGFTMGTPAIDAHVLMAAKWFDLGFDVALLTLPFHGSRCPRTARYSGEPFGTWDVARTNEAVRQAVQDIHLVKTWIELTSGRPVGIFGLSLGGYLAALMAGLCDDLAFVVPLVPPVFLDALARSLLDLDGRGRDAAPPVPIPLDELRAGYTVHCPLTYSLAIPKERVLIVGARGDCIVPPKHAYALWRHWGEPAAYWYSGSHTAPFGRARVAAQVQEHIEGLDLDWTPRACRRREAPRFRATVLRRLLARASSQS